MTKQHPLQEYLLNPSVLQSTVYSSTVQSTVLTVVQYVRTMGGDVTGRILLQ